MPIDQRCKWYVSKRGDIKITRIIYQNETTSYEEELITIPAFALSLAIENISKDTVEERYEREGFIFSESN